MRTVLFYYSKSSDKLPGKGSNEFISEDNIPLFLSLSRIQDWGKILSNFSVGEFEYNGFHYRTAEHAFQGSKIALADLVKAQSFSLESGSVLSRGDGEDARKNRKMIVLNKALLRKWDKVKKEVMYSILFAKFSQVSEARRVLLATRDSELWHGTRGVPKTRQLDLEKIRYLLGGSQSLIVRCGSLSEEIGEFKKRKLFNQRGDLAAQLSSVPAEVKSKRRKLKNG
jgi:ribA/ribD-fused uncharacterized protein